MTGAGAKKDQKKKKKKSEKGSYKHVNLIRPVRFVSSVGEEAPMKN